MSTPNTFKYPAELLRANWDKNKGTVARLAGETGIGAALARLAARHAKVEWAKLSAMGYGKLHNPEEVNEAEKNAKAYHAANVAPYAAEARDVRDLAKEVAKKFAANKMIPKASTLIVLNIAKAADFVAVACKSMDEEFATFKAARDKLQKQIEDQKKMVGPNIDKLKKGLVACIAKPTKQGWYDHVRDNCRSINNGVQLNPSWKNRFGSSWVKHDGETFYNKLKDEAKLDEKAKKKQAEDIVKMCKDIQGLIPSLENYLKT